MNRTLVVAAATGLALILGVPAASAQDASLSAQIQNRLRDGALGRDTTVFVSDAASGSTLVESDADEVQLPASTMKLVTAVGALETLGRDHHFVTSVLSGSTPGQIVLRGGGDPMLTAADLTRLAARAAKGLGSQTGKVTVALDDHLFAVPKDAPGWEPGDMPSYVSAVRPLAMLGDYSSRTSVNAANVFVSALRSRGVAATLSGHTTAPSDSRVIASVDPHTVSDAIQLMLRVSENNIAETLFRDTAVARGYEGSWIGGGAAAREVLKGLGIETRSLVLNDGSGVSMKDRLTARTLGTLLERVVDPTHTELAPILHWLPVAGETGTLAYRYGAAPSRCARGEVFAKTGSLTGVNTLAGLTRGADGLWKAFAIMVNHRPMSFPNPSTSYAIDNIAATIHGCA